jgi:tetratricopeptide (TPR) repeat protein
MPTTARGTGTNSTNVLVGVAAHICAAAPMGPRFDALMTPQQRSHISNGIWLCPTHSVVVDEDEVRFTPSVLRAMREAHEARVAADLFGDSDATVLNAQLLLQIASRRPTNLWDESDALVGRRHELQRVIAALRSSGRHVISGEPAVGKSSLAREVAAHCVSTHAVRWWIDAADTSSLRAGLRDLALALGVASASNLPTAEEAAPRALPGFLIDLRDFLQQSSLRALVVLDNIDAPEVKSAVGDLALQFLPKGSCDVLMTSQSGQWSGVSGVTLLTGLDAANSIALLERMSGRGNLAADQGVQRLCSLVGGRPLFLKLVGSLIGDADQVHQFIDLLEQSPEEAVDALPGHDDAFVGPWRKSFREALARASQSAEGSGEVMASLAFMGNGTIPTALAVRVGEVALGVGGLQSMARLRAIEHRSLLERRENPSGQRGGYYVHPVVAGVVRRLGMEEDDTDRALGVALESLGQLVPPIAVLRQPGGADTMTVLAPHVASIVSFAARPRGFEPNDRALIGASALAAALAVHRRFTSDWAGAEGAAAIAMQLATKSGNVETSALRKVQLANFMRQRGRFEEAEALLQEAMPAVGRFASLADRAWALSVQARVIRHRPNSNPSVALKLLIESLPLIEEAFRAGPDEHRRQLSETLGYLSVLHRQLSRFNDAEATAERGVQVLVGESSTQVMASNTVPGDPLLATHLRALGGVWRLRGHFQKAMRAQELALRGMERAYGSNHTDYYRALDSLGRVQREWGEFTAALETFEKAESIGRAQFGPGHAHVATAAANKALVLLELHRPDVALMEAERAFETYRGAYQEPVAAQGLKNEATVWALFIRADALAASGQVERALNDHLAVLDWRDKTYASAHAHQASSHYAIAEVLRRRRRGGDKSSTVARHKRALDIRRSLFGSAPNYWLALSQLKVGELTGDCMLVRAALDYFKGNLKPGHWRTSDAEAVLARLTR